MENNRENMDYRTGEHENEKRHIPGPLGGHEKNPQTGINTEHGTTDEFIDTAKENSFRGGLSNQGAMGDNAKPLEPRKHKGGTVDDKDEKGVWHPDDVMPDKKHESEGGLTSMQNNSSSDYDEGKP